MSLDYKLFSGRAKGMVPWHTEQPPADLFGPNGMELPPALLDEKAEYRSGDARKR